MGVIYYSSRQIPVRVTNSFSNRSTSILICQVTKTFIPLTAQHCLLSVVKVWRTKEAIITGQNMAFVNWSEIDTPYGVRVCISLGTDSLGADGINVWSERKMG